MFDEFDGHQASGDYDGANLIESWSTARYGEELDATLGKYIIRLRLNAAGRAAVVAAAGGVFRLMLVSSRDSDADIADPSGNEYVMFEASSARLNLRYNGVTMEDADASVYLDYEPVETGYAAMQLIRKALVDDYTIDDRRVSLELRDNNFRHDPLMPAKLISETDWPDAPADNIGKAYPVVYGKAYPESDTRGIHGDGIGIDSGAGVPGLRDYFAAHVIKFPRDSYEVGFVQVAGRTAFSSLSGHLALWNGQHKTFERLWAIAGSDITAADGSVYFEIQPRLRVKTESGGVPSAYERYFGRCFSCIPAFVNNQLFGGGTVSDPEDAYSGEAGDYAQMETAGDYFEAGFDQQGFGGDIDRREVVFDLVNTGNGEVEFSLYEQESDVLSEGSTGYISAGAMGIFHDSNGTFVSDSVSAENDYLIIETGPNRGKYLVYLVNNETTLTIAGGLFSQAETSIDYYIADKGAALDISPGVDFVPINTGSDGQRVLILSTEITDPKKYKLRFEYTSGSGAIRISNLQLRLYSPEFEKTTTIYLDKQGTEYGSWITGRAGGYLTGALIENPAHVIEAIARNEMRLATADINTASFDTAAGLLAAWKFGFQIDTQARAREILNKLAKQCKARLYWDADDKLKISVFNPAAHFPVSGTDIPTGLDIFDATGTPAGGVCATNMILPESFETGLIEKDQLYNDFTLRYRPHGATGEYQRTIYITHGSGVAGNVETNLVDADLENGQTVAGLSALTAGSYTKYGSVERKIVIDAPAIRDTATASRLLQYHVERQTWRPRWVRLGTKFSAIGHEPGDFVNVRDNRLEPLYGTAVMRLKKWEIAGPDDAAACIKTDLDRCRREIVAIEV